MTTQEFLFELRRLDVDLWLEGDRVRCSAPPDVLTLERRAELARRKTEIEVLLKAARAAAPGSIVPIEGCGSGLPFYAVPGHNGDVFCFVRLARCLGTDRAFYGLQPPGLAAGESPIDTVEELAVPCTSSSVSAGRPYQLGGYCLGGQRRSKWRAAAIDGRGSAGARAVRHDVAGRSRASQPSARPSPNGRPIACAAPRPGRPLGSRRRVPVVEPVQAT